MLKTTRLIQQARDRLWVTQNQGSDESTRRVLGSELVELEQLVESHEELIKFNEQIDEFVPPPLDNSHLHQIHLKSILGTDTTDGLLSITTTYLFMQP